VGGSDNNVIAQSDIVGIVAATHEPLHARDEFTRRRARQERGVAAES
jgi:hypothetical protein